MSHIHDGPLATYNSLTDKNLAGYFSNSRMRKHLRKSGLINRKGVLLSENQYRLNMARKEHKKHVKELLAQAIVHKTLDIERTRQVEVRRKLEEIAKIELVRRVKTSRGRKGDEEILPYLSPRPSRPSSRPTTASEHRYRPRSAPSRDKGDDDYADEIVYVDDRGRRLSSSPHGRDERPSKGRPEEIDTKHLYALDSAALRKYALHLSRIEQADGSVSPYLQSPVPTPPRSARSSRTGTASLRFRQRPRTAEARETSPYRDRKQGEVQGTLMLHRQEPAMMHQGEVQTLCEITMKYHGPNLTLPRDQHDPCQSVHVEQQHCGGNTLPVFKEGLKPGDTFSFVSRRHRGYPFSLSIYIDGRIDCRVSTCCEYRHAKGVKLGGKMGHFSLLKVTGATPCYKCKLISQASPRSLRRPPSTKSKQKPEELKEDVIIVDRKQIQEINEEDKYGSDSFEESDGEDKKTDRDDKEDDKKSSSSSSSSSRSSSRSSHSDSEEEVDRNAVKHIVYEDKKKDKREIIGLQADGDRERESVISKDNDSVSDVNVLGRKIDGYSDDEEYPDGPKYRSEEPYSMATKVTAEEIKSPERGRGNKARDSRSSSRSSSSSSSRSRSRSRSPVPEKRKSPSPVRSPSPEQRRSPSPVRTASPEQRRSLSPVRTPSPEQRRSPVIVIKKERRGSLSSRSSTSSVHISDAEEEKKIPKIEVQDSSKRRSSSSSSSSSSGSDTDRKEQEMERSPSPFPEPFTYTSYSEEIEAREPVKQAIAVEESPIPEAYTYKKMYEKDDNKISQTVVVQTEPLPEPVSYKKQYESDKSSSSSSDSGSESEREVKKTEPESPKKTEPVKKSSSSSSSSDSSSESESKKKEPVKKATDLDDKVVEPPRAEVTKKSDSSSSESSSSSSDSESDSEDESKKNKTEEPKAASPEVQQKETKPTVKTADKSDSESSGSSDSSSDSDSDSEEDTDRKPKQEVKVAKIPSPPEEPKETTKKDESSSSSSGSDSSSEDSESETERSKENAAKAQNSQMTPSPEKQARQASPVQPAVKKEEKDESGSGSDSDSSSSSSDSSDSEDENQKKATDKETSAKVKDSDSESESKKIVSMVTSESEAEQKKVSIFASESDGENMHGGNDPDRVAEDGAHRSSFMSRIGGVQTATAQPGPIVSRFEGKKDLEVTNIDLDIYQVTEIADYMERKYHVQTFCVRNAGIDDNKFMGITDGLILTKSDVKLVNLNLNKLTAKSSDKLVEVLKEKPGINILLLHGNPLGDDGVKKLVDGLLDDRFTGEEDNDKHVESCQLKELDLGDTGLGDKGIGHVSRFLETNTSLETLNLNGNTGITVNGWRKLGKALKRNTTLTTLTLDFNRIGDEGISALISGLKDNQTLKTLDLEDTNLTQEGGRKLVELLKCNTTILDITISPGNSIPDKLRDEIRNYLGLNQAASTPPKFGK